MRRGAIILAAGILAAGLAACTQQAARAPAGDAPSIVSLNPCTDAILAEVTEPAQLLAISHYSHDPRATSMDIAAARRFAVTGGTVEEVLALQPDIVVAGSFLAPSTANALRKLGIRVETVGVATRVDDSKAQIRRLAVLAGHPQRGEALVGRIDAALDDARYEGEWLTALLWQSGGIVPGEDALISELMHHTGFASHSAARGLGQGAYLPLEQVLADPPEVILLAGGDRAMAHPALSALKSVRRERLDPSLLYCGGPSIIRAVERLAQIRNGVGI